MAKFVPTRGARYCYRKHINLTNVKGLSVSTVQFTNGFYETVIFNDSNDYYRGYGAEILVPGSYLIIDMQYNHFTKRDALRAHREYVDLINRYAK